MSNKIEYSSGQIINENTGVIFLEEVAPRIKEYNGYKTVFRKAKFLCPCGEEFVGDIADVKSKKNKKCPKCGKKKFIQSRTHYKDGEAINEKGTILLERLNNVNSSVQCRFKCGKCGQIFIAVLNDVLSGSGYCSTCGRRERVENLRIYKPGMVIENPYGQKFILKNLFNKEETKYLKGIFQEIDDNGNNIKEEFSGSLYNVVYGNCVGKYTSRANMIFENILKKINVKYVPEKSFSDLFTEKGGHPRYDFYIELFPQKFLIELDGKQHFYSIDFFGGEEGYRDRKKIDQIKNEYALSHGYILIRIPYTDFNKINEDFVRNILFNQRERG